MRISHAEDLERDISLYKRNIYFADNDQLDSIEQTGYGLKTVSYTHLDVYKRQLHRLSY